MKVCQYIAFRLNISKTAVPFRSKSMNKYTSRAIASKIKMYRKWTNLFLTRKLYMAKASIRVYTTIDNGIPITSVFLYVFKQKLIGSIEPISFFGYQVTCFPVFARNHCAYLGLLRNLMNQPGCQMLLNIAAMPHEKNSSC
jgi:hypothetical protein